MLTYVRINNSNNMKNPSLFNNRKSKMKSTRNTIFQFRHTIAKYCIDSIQPNLIIV